MYHKTIVKKLTELENERLKRIEEIKKHLRHLSQSENNFISRKYLLESELYKLQNLKIF